MTALSRLETLPDWPARMTASVAAAYMGVSQTTFLTRFGSIGVREGGSTLWARGQLDRIVNEQFGLSQSVAQSADDAYDVWKAERNRK